MGLGAATPARSSLPPEPESVGQARHLVTNLLERNGLPDLIDTATLLTSEVVTNAVLHAATRVEVACHLHERGLLVQVRDHSPVLPGMRHYDAEAMTGRGLGLVEMLAARWGVEADAGGKTIWFYVSDSDAPDDIWPALETAVERATFAVHFMGLPTSLAAATIQYTDTVLREMALLTLSDSSMGTAAPAWPGSGIDLGPLLEEIAEAQGAGATTADIVMTFPVGAGTAALQRMAMAEEADGFARDGLLLSAAALPEVASCRRWLLSQVAIQEDGAEPAPWELPASFPPFVTSGELPQEVQHQLDIATTAAVVADDGNRIIYANQSALQFLGWEGHDLIGRRLVTIIPPAYREAHLAGFMRYLLTSEPQMLGRRVRLPVLRRDGSQVEADLLIETLNLKERRTAFRATFF